MKTSRIPFDIDNPQCLYEIARLKYRENRSEREIAEYFGFEQDNRTRVRKALAKAERMGIIIRPDVTIVKPGGLPIDHSGLETRLCAAFGLKHAHVIDGLADAYQGHDRDLQNMLLDRMAHSAAIYFNALIEGPPPHSTACVNWGYAMRLFTNHVTDLEPTQRIAQVPRKRHNLVILPMVGIMGTGNRIQVAEREAYQLALELARKYDAEPMHLPCPAIIREPEHALVVEQVRPVRRSLELLGQATIAVTGIGHVDDHPEAYQQMTTVQQQLLTVAEVEQMHAAGAVGEIANWFFNSEGRQVDDGGPNGVRLKPIGLGLDGLRRIASNADGHVIAICGADQRRLAALRACVTAEEKLVTALFTDHLTATDLLESL